MLVFFAQKLKDYTMKNSVENQTKQQEKTKAEGVLTSPAAAHVSISKKSNNNTLPSKWQRVLTAILNGNSFNRFEAERQLNDHCLHSTVSYIERLGVVIERKFETVRGWQGIPTHVCRYWLDKSEENIKLVNLLLKRPTTEG